MKLYNIFYSYGGEYTYEITTDNFEKWLEQHNKDRVESGNEPEDKSEFDVVPIDVATYNEESEDDN